MHDFESATRNLNLQMPSPLVRLDDDTLDQQGVTVYLKRDDLIHPDLPGNKWRKLKYNLAEAINQGAHTILTFGGAYSNHIRAVSVAANRFGLASIGVIRGEPHEQLNDVLSFATGQGMELTYLDRPTYRRKSEPAVLESLRVRFGDFFLIPEGGSNSRAVRGCAELPNEIESDFDVICCPCGTGGTLAGLAGSLRSDQRAVGFSALKGGGFLNRDVATLQESAWGRATSNWQIQEGFHFGGFAKKNEELTTFIENFERNHSIRLDWIYVAKMMYGLYSMVRDDKFDRGNAIVAVITG